MRASQGDAVAARRPRAAHVVGRATTASGRRSWRPHAGVRLADRPPGEQAVAALGSWLPMAGTFHTRRKAAGARRRLPPAAAWPAARLGRRRLGLKTLSATLLYGGVVGWWAKRGQHRPAGPTAAGPRGSADMGRAETKASWAGRMRRRPVGPCSGCFYLFLFFSSSFNL
jgi:hypothetical protein